MQENDKDYIASNKNHWNQRVHIHKDSAFYDVDGFINGNSSLNEIELGEIGDVKNKSLLHLQCHFGMDTLSFARMGAKATGLDFSEDAIFEARKLNDLLGLDATFICNNVYDLLPGNLNNPGIGQFDIIFTSYGVIGWLPDLDAWAACIAHHLAPGGIFYMAEFHPILWMFDDDFTRIIYPYHNAGVIKTKIQGTYAQRDAPIEGYEYGWNHGISEVINALTGRGLEIKFFNEHNYSPYNCFNHMQEAAPGQYVISGLENKIPLVYSIMAVKK